MCPKGCEGSNPSSPTLTLACGNAGQFRLIWGPREVVRFTYANKRANDRRVTSMRKPRGHIRKRPFGYEISVPEGRDPISAWSATARALSARRIDCSRVSPAPDGGEVLRDIAEGVDERTVCARCAPAHPLGYEASCHRVDRQH